MADIPWILSGFFLDYALPFALVFTLVFAVLQKTKLLGDGKKQVDALVALIVGLILVATPYARDIVIGLMPFLAVFAAILLVFMLLYGFISGKKEGDILSKGWKYVLIGILALSLAIALLVVSGYWDAVFTFATQTQGARLWMNLLIIAVIVGAIIAVVLGGGKSSSS